MGQWRGASRMFTNMVTRRMPGCFHGNARTRLEFLGIATKYPNIGCGASIAAATEGVKHGRGANPTRRTGSRAGYCAK
jgi:hypothetical protein